jgi:hypothetical protein
MDTKKCDCAGRPLGLDPCAECQRAAENGKENAPRSAAACSAGWLPIESAPKDGTEIVVYCPPAHKLNHMASVCAYDEDAGFCVCELREPTLWIPLPNERGMP